MLKFLIPKIEYITVHPLTWSADVRQFLNVEIVDTLAVDALRSVPAQRALGSDISDNLSVLRAVRLTSLAPKYYGFGGFLYKCITAVKTANGEPDNVSSFLEKFETGAIRTDPLKVTRTTITIGDGSSILEFAKVAVASALEPEMPDPPIIRRKYVRTVKRPPSKQQKEGIAGSSV